MARRERREHDRIPVEIEVFLDPEIDGESEPVPLSVRARNINMRGAFFELPPPETPPMPWSTAAWWEGRRLNIRVNDGVLVTQGPLESEAEVRWIARRGPKRRPVGIGVLFLQPSNAWLDALQGFLDSLVT